jgi:alanyl-tRNA synthetase
MPLDEARESGAMALFGEKYDDEVRVVSMGRAVSGQKPYSVELCGGTHVKKTSDIGKFKIISESALSSGVRRVEALTGPRVDAYEADKQNALQSEHSRLMAENKNLREALKQMGGEALVLEVLQDLAAYNVALQKDNKKLQKEIDDLRRQQATADAADDGDIKDIAGVKFTGRVLDGFPPKDLKPMADDLKAKLGSGVVALVSTNDGKASIVVAVTEDLTDRINAVDLVRVGSEALGGKGGGGRPDMAQAGGPNADAANDAVSSIENALAG